MLIADLIFYLFSFVLLFSGMMVISAKNPVHAVLFLILAFFNAAGLFVLLGAEFIAMILVVVYVGAVAVLFLFVVMMLDINFAELRRGIIHYLPIGAVVGAVLIIELLTALSAWSFSTEAVAVNTTSTPAPSSVSNTHALGMLLYTHYLFLFQIAGFALLVAMIGSIILTLRTRPDVRRQKVADQVARKPSDVLSVKKVTPGTGV